MRTMLLFLMQMVALLTTSLAAPHPSYLGLDPIPHPSVAKQPIYLGGSDLKQPVVLGRSASFSWNQTPWYPLWPRDSDFLLQSAAQFTPSMNPLDIGLYHVPSIVEFLSPDYRSEGINYTQHIPALEEFASPGWSPPNDSQLYHVPALTSFLKDDWQPSAPEYDGYPPGSTGT
jgi:hypothetical protein